MTRMTSAKMTQLEVIASNTSGNSTGKIKRLNIQRKLNQEKLSKHPLVDLAATLLKIKRKVNGNPQMTINFTISAQFQTTKYTLLNTNKLMMKKQITSSWNTLM